MATLTEAISYLKRGKTRIKIFTSLKDNDTPTELTARIYGNAGGTALSVISRELKGLKKKKLVVIKNPKMKTGRLYALTKFGKKVLKEL